MLCWVIGVDFGASYFLLLSIWRSHAWGTCKYRALQYLKNVQSADPTFKTYITLFKGSPSGRKTVANLLSQSIFMPSISLSKHGQRSARIFLCIQSCVHTLMEQTFPFRCQSSTGHVDIGILFYFIGITQSCIIYSQLKSDWLFNTQSNVLQADWLIVESKEKATLNINMPSVSCINMSLYISFKQISFI